MHDEQKALLTEAAEGIREMLPDFGLSTREQKQRVELQASLRQIEHALAKFALGTYGQCEKCGGLIDDDALDALPARLHCNGCE